jgi:urate oxidase
MAKLIGQRYGKARVRVLKILRDGPIHTIKEIDVTALLSGDFCYFYTAGDNTKVVDHDTIKNTINVLATAPWSRDRTVCGDPRGSFLTRYPRWKRRTSKLPRARLSRMKSTESRTPILRAGDESETFTRVTSARAAHAVQSGIRGLVILKSAARGLKTIEMRSHNVAQKRATAFSPLL